jgi:phenylalanyl-tRNA synthetase beta chain
MKVSLNLAQHYGNVDLKSIPREELLRRIGSQLGAVEEVTDWALMYEGAVIVRVVSCEKHPNADKLNVCQVEDGSGQTTQVICGAPNVRVGMYAVWLKPGVTVPSTRSTDPFVLEAREIRGVMSHGMMASPKELGISDAHDGILEVDPSEVGREPGPGEPLAAYFGLDDYVIDCENKMFTHRPDCFGNLGVARELAGISGLDFESPDWYLGRPVFEDRQELPLQVENDIPKLVPRFMAVVMKDVTVKASPIWLQALLTRIGIKSINNIVDVTNFVMHLTGQPLHAFDYDKLHPNADAPTLRPRLARKGEALTLLGGKTIELNDQDMVITADDRPVALAGVMGGAETEVGSDTKNIVIECATFDMYTIRRTSMRHGLFTDAVTRFTKGQSPAQNDRVLAFAMQEMARYAGAVQASAVFDLAAFTELGRAIEIPISFINDRLGAHLTGEDMCRLLNNVEFQVESDDEKIVVTSPFWRMDIVLPEDVVEEIGRLYGYDRLPVALPPRTAKPAPKNQLLEFKQQLRDKLKHAGANELLTYTFVHGDLLRKTGTDPERWAYHIRNALSPDLQYYRTSIMPSLLNKVHGNIKAAAGSTDNQFALFELGRAHVTEAKENGLPVAMERLALVVAADDKTVKHNYVGSAYYLAKRYLDELTGQQAAYTVCENFEYPITAPYQPGRAAIVSVGGEVLGVIGEFHVQARKALKLPDFSAGFELDTAALMKHLLRSAYQPLPPFPETSQDITVEVRESTYAEAIEQLEHALTIAAEESGYGWRLEPMDLYQVENETARKLTFRVTLWHPARTLTTDETNRIMEGLRV